MEAYVIDMINQIGQIFDKICFKIDMAMFPLIFLLSEGKKTVYLNSC